MVLVWALSVSSAGAYYHFLHYTSKTAPYLAVPEKFNLAALPKDSNLVLRTVIDSAVKNLKPSVQSDVLFTDDRAPVETIVDSMVLNFLTGGGAGQFTAGTTKGK